MNLYMIVEGKKTETSVYPAWLSILAPHLMRVDDPRNITDNCYYLFSGEVSTNFTIKVQDLFEMDDDDLLEHIEHSYALEQHDSEVREIYYRECIDEWLDELSGHEKEKLDELRNCYPDDLHQFICDLIGVGYYDKEGLMKGLGNLKDKLNKNSYGIKYEA